MKQIKLVARLDYYAHVRHVEPFGLGDESHKVSALDGFSLLGVEPLFFEVGIAVHSIPNFKILHFSPHGTVGELQIAVAMLAHEVESLYVVSGTVYFGCDFANVTAVEVVHNPVADVVQSGGVVAQLSVAIADILEVAGIVAPRGAAIESGAGECVERFYEGGAIKLVDVDGEPFAFAFEGVGNVGRAHQFACVELHQSFRRLLATLCAFR